MEDKDCTYLLEGRDPSRILRKTLAILEHQVTKDDVKRQMKIIDQYLFVSQNGFFIRDLSNVMYLFELVRGRLFTDPEFNKPMSKLLDLCSIPPILTRSLDLITFDADLQEYFSWFGYMIIWLNNRTHLMKAIYALHSLLTKKSPQRNYVSLELRKEKARSSSLTDLLGDLLEIVEDDIYLDILKILQVLIDGSEDTCKTLLKKNAVSTIILRLEPTWRQRFPSTKPMMPKATEEIPEIETIFLTLISLLADADSKIMKAPTKFTLWSLQWTFRLFTIKETTNVDRNNVLAILLLLMDIYPDLLQGNVTFAYDIAMLAMAKDIVFHSNWISDIKLTTSHEDHSCVALLLMCISYFPNFLTGPKVIEECRVVMGLMKLLGNQQAIKWHQLQACYLIRLSLNILHKIVPASTEEFVEDGGPLTILQLLNRSLEHPNQYSYDIIFRSVELLSHLSYKFKSIRDSIAYNGGVNCVLRLCQDVLKHKYILENYQNLLCASICLLEQTCNLDDVYQVLCMIVSYMKRFINYDTRGHIQKPKLIIICLSFIWNKVTSSEILSEEFVKMNGVYLILDIAKIGCLPVKLVALGTLVDLCENAQCIPYLITWRNNGQGIISLLMEIFRQENEQLLVKTDENGIILDYLFPIIGASQFYETYCLCHRNVGNAGIADMFISCRPKVYCLLQILNHKQNETVQTVNEFYNVYNEKLSVQDEVTYVLADNFLALKLGEEWKEIQQDFKKMFLEPIPSDQAIFKRMADITDKWGKDLQRMQREIWRKHQLKEWEEEQKLYNTLRNSGLADAWESLSEMRYIAHCSERLFRITSNFNIQSQISKSLHVDELNGQLHRTFQSNLSVTCVSNQSVQIPIERSEESRTQLKPIIVSPISSKMSTPRLPVDELQGEYLPEEMITKTKSEHDLEKTEKSVSFFN